VKNVLFLLKPRFWAYKKSAVDRPGENRGLRRLVLGALGVVVWGGVGAMTLRMLIYFKSVAEIGDILAFKLLSMAFITLFALLLFSGILTTLAKLYLSKDLFLVHALPVPAHEVYLARWLESTLDSSWMMVIFTLPVFVAYGIVYRAGLFFYMLLPLNLIFLSLIASSVSALIVMLAAVMLPANRIRSIIVFLGLAMFMVLFIAFRLLRPERLVNPENFVDVLSYLQTLQTPASPYLPSTWAYDAMQAALNGSMVSGVLSLGLAASAAAVLIVVSAIVADRFYFEGFSRAQTAPARLWRPKKIRWRLRFLDGPTRAYLTKEIKIFFRDQTQWSQLFLIGALIIIYVYNFKVLPLEKAPIRTIYLQNFLSFLNMGLAAFVLTAICGRFVYPATSMEGDAFWIVRSAPITIRRFLWVKFFVYLGPLLLLAEILTVATNLMLQVTPFMMGLSTATMLAIVPGVVAIALGMGAAYPNFKSENPAQSVTSFGGLVFMLVCAGYIAGVVILEAGPVYAIFMAAFRNQSLAAIEWTWILISFGAVLLTSTLAVVLPMRFGIKRLSKT
jgi:ABC-2 type transport system permease protein